MWDQMRSRYPPAPPPLPLILDEFPKTYQPMHSSRRKLCCRGVAVALSTGFGGMINATLLHVPSCAERC